MCPWIYFMITFVLWLPKCSPLAFSAFTAHFPEGGHPSFLSLSSPFRCSLWRPKPTCQPFPLVDFRLCILLQYYFTKGVCSFFRSFLFSPEPSFPTSLSTQLRDPSLPPCSLQRFWVGTQESFAGHWCLFFSLQVI